MLAQMIIGILLNLLAFFGEALAYTLPAHEHSTSVHARDRPSDSDTIAGFEKTGYCFGYLHSPLNNVEQTKTLLPCEVYCHYPENCDTVACPQPTGVTNPPKDEIFTDDDGSEYILAHCTCSGKTAVLIEDYDYSYIEEETEDDDLEDPDSRWEVDADPSTYLDMLSFQRSSSTINIWDAKNNNDPLKNLRFRDILMAFWQAKAGAKLGSLKSFYFDSVVEASTEAVLESVIQTLGKGYGEKFTLSPDSTDANEALAYQEIMDRSKLVGIVTLTLTEFKELAGRDVTSLTVKVGAASGVSSNLWVNI